MAPNAASFDVGQQANWWGPTIINGNSTLLTCPAARLNESQCEEIPCRENWTEWACCDDSMTRVGDESYCVVLFMFISCAVPDGSGLNGMYWWRRFVYMARFSEIKSFQTKKSKIQMDSYCSITMKLQKQIKKCFFFTFCSKLRFIVHWYSGA